MTQPNLSTQLLQQLQAQSRAFRKYASRPPGKKTDTSRLRSITDTRQLAQLRAQDFQEKCARALDACPLSIRDRRDLQTIGVYSPRPARFISDQATNHGGREVFYEAMFTRLSGVLADEGVTMFFITIVDRSWCLPKGAKAFDRTKVIHRAKRALRDIGYHGILFLEIQPVLNMKDVRFMPHLHGLVWCRKGDGALKPRAAKSLLNLRFTAMGDAKGVDLVRVPSDEPRALAQRYFYATKLPHDGKSFNPAPGIDHAFGLATPGRFRRSASRNFTDREALRVLRLLAPHSLEELVFAVGEGTMVRKVGSKALDAAARLSPRTFRSRLPADAVTALITRLLGD